MMPIKEIDYDKSIELAIKESIFCASFVYIFMSNNGYYIIDNVGILYSDEKLIMKLYRGRKIK